MHSLRKMARTLVKARENARATRTPVQRTDEVPRSTVSAVPRDSGERVHTVSAASAAFSNSESSSAQPTVSTSHGTTCPAPASQAVDPVPTPLPASKMPAAEGTPLLAERGSEPTLRLSRPRPPADLRPRSPEPQPCTSTPPLAVPQPSSLRFAHATYSPSKASAMQQTSPAGSTITARPLKIGSLELPVRDPANARNAASAKSQPGTSPLSIAPPEVQEPRQKPSSIQRQDSTTEDVILAVGRTVDAFNHRRMNDCLEMLFAAQKEEIALFTQADTLRNEKFIGALLEARQDYQGHLEQAVTRIIEELADGQTLPGALGQISNDVGAYIRRSERMHEKMLLAIRDLGSVLAAGFARLDSTLNALAGKAEGEPARVLTLIPSNPSGETNTAEKKTRRSVLEDLDDEIHDQETHA